MRTIVLRLLLSAVIAMQLVSCSGRAEAPPTARIDFLGDIIMHIPVKNCAMRHNQRDPETGKSINNGGYDYLYEKITPYLQGDVVLGNMEFPVKAPFKSIPWHFNAPPQALKAMRRAGITMVTLANNHTLDQGHDGISSSIRHLHEADIEVIGAAETEEVSRRGLIKNINGIHVAFLGYTGITNNPLPKDGTPSVNWLYDREKVIEDIRRARAISDYVVVVSHAGAEYSLTPTDKDRQVYLELAESGADCIVGHHPHILQPYERYETSTGRQVDIFYSLGNFISNQSSVKKLPGGETLSTRDTVILTVHLQKHVTEDGFISVSSRWSALPVYTYNVPDTRRGGKNIQVRAVADELPEKNSAQNSSTGVDLSDHAMYRKFQAIQKAMRAMEKTGLSFAEVNRYNGRL